jgi:Ca2+-transporting ATPase
MWKMIIGQSIFQLTVTLILHFGPRQGFLDYPDEYRRSIVFNTFVWMQVFNEFNNRRLDNRFNIFTGLHRNWFFIGINCIMVSCQIVIAFYGGAAFSIVAIEGEQWAICILVAAISLPWAICIRLFPDPWFKRIAKFVGKPVILVYGPLSRGAHRLAQKIRPRKHKSNSAEGETSDQSTQRSPNGDPEKGQ